MFPVRGNESQTVKMICSIFIHTKKAQLFPLGLSGRRHGKTRKRAAEKVIHAQQATEELSLGETVHNTDSREEAVEF